MKIENVYKLIVLKDIIKSLLADGIAISYDDVVSQLNSRINDNDLTTPAFSKDIAKVVYNEEAIAEDWRDLLSKAALDIEVLFTAVHELIAKESILADRWDEDIKALEKEIDDLTERVQELLHTLSDTTGYFSYVGDDFANSESFKKMDSMTPYPHELLKDNSSWIPARIDINTHTVSIPPATDGQDATTKIDLHDIDEQNIKFTIQTIKDMSSSVLAAGSKLKYIFMPQKHVWKQIVRMKKPGKVVGVLQVQLDIDSISLSRMECLLHTVSIESSVSITPQYSNDGKNWYFIPNVNIMKTGYDAIVYVFPAIQAKYLRLIMEKANYDYEDRGLYIYEFGLEELKLFNDSYSTTQAAFYSTRPLKPKEGSNILKKADEYIGDSFKFTRASLEVCEDVPENTEINYFLSVDDGKSWHPVDPINRPNPAKPTVVDFTQRGIYTVDGVRLSYDETKALAPEEIFPGRNFTSISWLTGSDPGYSASAVTFPDKPYIPYRQEHTILDTIFKDGSHIVFDTLLIWRNVGTKGNDDTVRNGPRGWRKEGAYYTTVVKVNNSSGLAIDLGKAEAIIDSGKPVRGKVTIPYGIHTFKTHKDNWREVSAGATSLTELIDADPLYPYNHKLLIEGYSYDSSFSDEIVYRGVDRFAGYLLKPTDLALFKQMDTTEYGRYAVIEDMTDGTYSYNAIVVKFDPTYDDFTNEEFIIEIPDAKEMWDNISFLAVLRTRDSSVTPMFSKYVIRLSL